MEKRISTGLTAAEGRKFGVTLGIAFAALGGIAFWRDHGIAALVLWGVAGLFLAGGLLIPTRLTPIERGWMSLAEALSRVTTPIVLSIVYFVVLSPIGLVVRAIKGNPLKHPASHGGYWFHRERSQAETASMRRQF